MLTLGVVLIVAGILLSLSARLRDAGLVCVVVGAVLVLLPVVAGAV